MQLNYESIKQLMQRFYNMSKRFLMTLDELHVQNDYFEFDEAFYQKLSPTPLNHAHLIAYSKDACDLIGLDYEQCETDEFVDFVNGKKTLNNSEPYAMVYAGHQFGYFVPQLGDGRAINLGRINHWHLQTKGSGLTRYSRQGDGRAVLCSSIREFIMSEAMHALDIPTTRALALIGSGHEVYRYYGEKETGAVVLRLSPSWIRFGTFEFFAKQPNAKEHLEQLANYVIKQSYPHLMEEPNKYEKMFFELVDKTAVLLAKWQAYGFMHGVMNTDNMSMAGLGIDYGPFAFMDTFDVHNICNHTDEQGRYSYSSQPYIAQWNLQVLAKALGQICEYSKLEEYLKTYFSYHEKQYLTLMGKRLGLDNSQSHDNLTSLVVSLLDALQESKVDYNRFFYALTQCNTNEQTDDVLSHCKHPLKMKRWLQDYKKIKEEQKESFAEQKALMKKNNPKYIIKNYMLQEAIDKAQEGDFSLVNDLLYIAQNPYLEHESFERYSQATPIKESNLRLSCSS